MKVGDYVRTKKGIIGKIIKCNSIYFILDNDKDNIAHEQDEIIKSSPNIIDLIEEEDIVNGYFVEFVDKEDKMLICYGATLDIEDIKLIVTKEQFKSIEYEVK